MSATLCRVRARPLSRPYGPSTSTRVPGRSARGAALPSPTSLTVIRRLRPSGAADREYGLARVQPRRPRNRQMKNWPASTGSRCRRAAAHVDRHEPSASGTTEVDAEAVAQVAPDRQADPPHQHAGGQRPGAPPEDGAAGRGDELLPGPELVRQREADAEVGVEVEQVPRLVAQPPPGGLDAGHHDHARGARCRRRRAACRGSRWSGSTGCRGPASAPRRTPR